MRREWGEQWKQREKEAERDGEREREIARESVKNKTVYNKLTPSVPASPINLFPFAVASVWCLRRMSVRTMI